jgi:hypothetical protein
MEERKKPLVRKARKMRPPLSVDISRWQMRGHSALQESLRSWELASSSEITNSKKALGSLCWSATESWQSPLVFARRPQRFSRNQRLIRWKCAGIPVAPASVRQAQGRFSGRSCIFLPSTQRAEQPPGRRRRFPGIPRNLVSPAGPRLSPSGLVSVVGGKV